MSGFCGKDGDPLSIQVNVTRSFTEGSGVTWVTNVPQTASLTEINDISDKMMKAIDRQELHARAAALNNDLENYAKQKGQLEFSMAQQIERHGDFAKATQDVKAARDQTRESLSRLNLLIDSLTAEQARLRKGL